jgi:hypothetical protein
LLQSSHGYSLVAIDQGCNLNSVLPLSRTKDRSPGHAPPHEQAGPICPSPTFQEPHLHHGVRRNMLLLKKLHRHGLLGILRLLRINIRYYTKAPVRHYLKYSCDVYAPTVYGFFWQVKHSNERTAIQKLFTTAPSGTQREPEAIVGAIREDHKWVDCQRLQVACCL